MKPKQKLKVGDVCLLNYQDDGKRGTDNRLVKLTAMVPGARVSWFWTGVNFDCGKFITGTVAHKPGKCHNEHWDWEDAFILTKYGATLNARLKQIYDA